MIDLYTYSTINGQSVFIVLEEMQLNYKLHWIDLMKGEQRNPDFLKLNPSGRIPTIMDHSNDLILTQSSAILIYLAEKSGKFLSKETNIKANTLEWLMFHATDLAPNLYNNFYLKSLIKEPQPIAAQFIKDRYLSLYQHFDSQLSNHEFINGHEYSIADIAAYPSIDRLQGNFTELGYQNVIRWHKQLSQRPAVIKAMNIRS